jgi:hypothetical protein
MTVALQQVNTQIHILHKITQQQQKFSSKGHITANEYNVEKDKNKAIPNTQIEHMGKFQRTNI